MTVQSSSTPKTPEPLVRLAYIDLARFRRLSAVRIAIDPLTTVLVGANNSGKTSILTAIRHFLSNRPAFGAFDLSVDQWPTLIKLGETWQNLANDPATGPDSSDDWDGWLRDLLGCMPTLDLWFDVSPGGLQYAFPFLPSFSWTKGLIGVRLRLEPASTVDSLQALASRYRKARAAVADAAGYENAWPRHLVDYWLRAPDDLRKVVVYKLDPAKGPGATCPKSTSLKTKPTDTSKKVQTPSADSTDPAPVEDRPQELPADAVPIPREHVDRLIRVDFTPAQRGLGGEEADGRAGSEARNGGQFTREVLRFVRKHCDFQRSTTHEDSPLLKAILNAQSGLDIGIEEALEPTLRKVRALGYPGVHDPHKTVIRTRIEPVDLLDHGAAVMHDLSPEVGHSLPEYSIGLGYQNLQSLSFQLVSFRLSRLNPTTGAPAAVHLAMVEEPEAHLHVQAQQVFPSKAHDLLKAVDDTQPDTSIYAHLGTQLLLTTHSSHLAHAVSFTQLRYVRRETHSPWVETSRVINLKDTFGDKETETFAERYLRVQHTDLLFADGLILVEGTAERMLVPLFIEVEVPNLTSRYLSLLEIGGAHAHRLKPLIDRLGIPTVIIADIDPVDPTNGEARPIGDPTQVVTANASISKWLGLTSSRITVDQLNKLNGEIKSDNCKVYLAWQRPISSPPVQPSTFEDALILTNLRWFQGFESATGPLGKAAATVRRCKKDEDFSPELHNMLRRNFDKGDFAADLFDKFDKEVEGTRLRCPAYIKGALDWLNRELSPRSSAGAA